MNHFAQRLPPESFTSAAFAGLQDSAPRAALTARYSRVEDVSSTAWEHPTLVQTWAPRGAVFVVPRCDLAVFALGIVPRDAELRRALEQLAGKARDSTLDLGIFSAALCASMNWLVSRIRIAINPQDDAESREIAARAVPTLLVTPPSRERFQRILDDFIETGHRMKPRRFRDLAHTSGAAALVSAAQRSASSSRRPGAQPTDALS